MALSQSLAANARGLNEGFPGYSVGDSLRRLADSGQLGLGVPPALGGNGGTLLDAVQAIATVAAECLTSGFVFWCHRTLIQYLVASPNTWLQQEILPSILRAERSGATGLSNAMKHLSGIEPLKVTARTSAEAITLNGFLPWASNLQPDNFVVAIAASRSQGEQWIIAVPHDAEGLERGEDLPLIGLRASWTSTLRFNQTRVSKQWLISNDAASFLTSVRPAFLLLQCGLCLGMIQRSLQVVDAGLQGAATVLLSRYSNTQAQFQALSQQTEILASIAAPDFSLAQTRQLFEVRIALARLATQVVWLELEAKGGHAYLQGSDTERRLREVAFLPVLTPSIVQLEHALQQPVAGKAL